MPFKPPCPVRLFSLNTAVGNFLDSPYGIERIIIFFEFLVMIAQEHSDVLGGVPLPPELYPKQLLRPWHIMWKGMQMPKSTFFRDPESLQVAQVLATIDKVATYQEIFQNLDRLGGDPKSWYKKHIPDPKNHSHISRARVWLVECIIKHYPDLPTPTQHLLEQLLRPQPFKTWGDLLHGSNGASMPPTRCFVNNKDWEAAGSIVKVYLDIAMMIADIWARCPITDREFPRSMPGYKWFLTGLRWAERRFTHGVRDPFSIHPFRVRQLLREVAFARLWEKYWILADQESWDGDSVTMVIDRRTLRLRMYNCILRRATRTIRNPEAKRHLLSRFSIRDIVDADPTLDFTIFERVLEPRYIFDNIGGQFYGDRVPEAPPGHTMNKEDEELDLMIQQLQQNAQVEAFGPRHHIRDFAEEIKDIPDAELCSICMEEFSVLLPDRKRCIRLNDCQHLLHADCVDDWVNGDALNSNLCPECRTPIVAERRAVRAAVQNVGESSHDDEEEIVTEHEDNLDDEDGFEDGYDHDDEHSFENDYDLDDEDGFEDEDDLEDEDILDYEDESEEGVLRTKSY